MGRIIQGDAMQVLGTLFDKSVDCVVTSPPYWGLRDYGVKGQLGLEDSPYLYVKRMVFLFREIRRVLKDNGTIWINLGDTYNSGKSGSRDPNVWPKQSRNDHKTARKTYRFLDKLKPKDLVGIPWRVALALQDDGWYLRSDIIWYKTNPMPESVKDRPTKAHEHMFLLAKSPKYYYDCDAIREPLKASSIVRLQQQLEFQNGSKRAYAGTKTMKAVGSWNDHHNDAQASLNIGNKIRSKINHPLGANKRTVWPVATKPYKKAHFATFPPNLIKPCILAGCPKGGIVLDPFLGSGTTAEVAFSLGRDYLGIELNPEYIKLAQERMRKCDTYLQSVS